MKIYAQIQNGTVVNVFDWAEERVPFSEVPDEKATFSIVDITDLGEIVHCGYDYENGVFSAPPPPPVVEGE